MPRPLPPSRTRRIAKWTGLVACVVILAMWAVSGSHPSMLSTPYGGVLSISGVLIFDEAARDSVFLQELPWFVIPQIPGARDWRGTMGLSVLPNSSTVFGLQSVVVPFWLPFLIAAVPTAVLWRRDRRTSSPGTCSALRRSDGGIQGVSTDIDQYLHQGAPNWDAISFDVLCSRCGYNLRTLTRPQCTECGLEFEWPVMLDAAAWRSDFLFEHHWRTRPVQSWFKTVWLSLRPYRFWSRVSIHEAIEPKPLSCMLVSAVMAFVLAFHGTALVGAVLLTVLDRWIYPTGGGWPPAVAWNPSPLESVSDDLGRAAALPFSAGWEYLYLPGGVLMTLLAAVGLMCSLRQTLARCRVRSAQILRVTAYAATPICVLSGVVLAVDGGLIPVLDDLGTLGVPFIVCAAAAPLVIFGAYLGIGLRRYLRLRHGLTVGFVTAFVATLFTFTAFMFISLRLR